MEAIRQYLTTIITAVVITVLSIQILGKSSSYAPIIRMIAGVFLTITVISPITTVNISKIYDYFEQFKTSSECYITDGTSWRRSQTSSYIKAQAESYILDKAASLGITLSANIELSDSDPPIPVAVELNGDINPYLKQRLQRLIEEDLGVKLEAQTWNS